MSHDQEPMFPTSDSERRQLQEDLLEALAALDTAEANKARATKEATGKVAECEKKVSKLKVLLTASKPRQQHRDDG